MLSAAGLRREGVTALLTNGALRVIWRPPLQAGEARHAAVEALRAQGASVEIYTGDLADDAFRSFVARVRKQHGPVRGAVHAAGRVGDGARAYQSRSYEQVRSVVSPKTEGLHALRRALDDDQLVFLVSYSSIAA